MSKWNFGTGDWSTNYVTDWCLGSRREGLYPFLGEGIFTQDGRPWKHSREILRRQFARIEYQNLKVFDVHVNDLTSALSSAGTGVVDLQPHFFRFTLATTTDLIFGEPVRTVGHDLQETFATSFDYASYVSTIRIRLADFHWLYKTKKFKEACAIVKKYASHFVKQALKDQEENGEEAMNGRHAFILDLYEGLKDPDLVRDQLVHVLIAGRDTTACLLSWALLALSSEQFFIFWRAENYSFLLVRHPEVLNRLRKEIAAVLQDGEQITRAHIAKITYLKSVMNESRPSSTLHRLG